VFLSPVDGPALKASMKFVVATALVVALLARFPACAEEASIQQAASPAADEPYQPGLGEIMALQQMRHIKLWFAGRAGNWPLADYEIGELKEGFDEVTKRLGGDTVEKAVGAPLAALEEAVDAKNSATFGSAFDKLSDGCNSCHRTFNRAFIIISRPSLSPYSDQLFAPQ
jgi:hypothetical protein